METANKSQGPKIIQIMANPEPGSFILGLGDDGIVYELFGSSPRWVPMIPEIGYSREEVKNG